MVQYLRTFKYIVGIRLDCQVIPFNFPAPIPCLSLKKMLDADRGSDADLPSPGTVAGRHVQRALAMLAEKGINMVEGSKYFPMVACGLLPGHRL